MILGSHNAWSYLPPKKWYMKPLRFTAQCQDYDIKTQYNKYNVRCFDLRVRYDGDTLQVVHGAIAYKITPKKLFEDLKWLNDKGDVYVRLVHDVRSLSAMIGSVMSSILKLLPKDMQEDNTNTVTKFYTLCGTIQQQFPNIKFWCGKTLDGTDDTWKDSGYKFKYSDPSCEENYASVDNGSKTDDLYPRVYARNNNKQIFAKGTSKDILLIDFVNYIV